MFCAALDRLLPAFANLTHSTVVQVQSMICLQICCVMCCPDTAYGADLIYYTIDCWEVASALSPPTFCT
eukprot:1030155-Rhodomonas_salina.1